VNVLVTGAAGMLGRAVCTALAPRFTVTGVDLPDGDLTAPASVAELFAHHRPAWVVHTAAYTDVDGAEAQPEMAMAVNGDATAHVARACTDHGAGLTYISTDYVFAGDADSYAEDAIRNPISSYGASKARGEEAVITTADHWQIVRTSWLFGPGPQNFVLTMRRLLAAGQTIRVVDDQIGCPTYAPDLAQVLLFLLEKGGTGVYHATNQGVCSWYTFAQEIARQSGVDQQLVRPCATSDYPTPARRPACSVLRSRRLEELGCPPRAAWQDALNRYLAWLEDNDSSGQNDRG
jgi:dTDP-4-dehydrorhamnose reductase